METFNKTVDETLNRLGMDLETAIAACAVTIVLIILYQQLFEKKHKEMAKPPFFSPEEPDNETK